MKRYISMFLMVIVCYLLETTVFSKLRLGNIAPNLLIVLTTAAGFMYGRKIGMFTGCLCGGVLDLFYGDVIGIYIAIFVLIGYVNGMANKLYYKDDISIPMLAVALSDLSYGILYYISTFLMRGRFNVLTYLVKIILPEVVYTVIVGIVLYKLLQWLEEKMYHRKEGESNA